MSWLSARSDYKMSSNRERSYTDIEAISNILELKKFGHQHFSVFFFIF